MTTRDDIAAFNGAFSAALAAQDVDAVVASYTEDARLLFDIREGDSFVVDVGRYMTPTGSGKYIVVHERQADRSLRMAVDSATGDGAG